MTTSSSGIRTLNKPSLFWLAIVLTLAGFWLSPYPPLVDFAQHSAQIVALQEFWSGNPLYMETFQLNWFAPYTATYLVYYTLALLLPVAIAGKLLISLTVIAVPVITRQLLRETGSDSGWSWLTIPGSLSVAFYWGFMPFLLAIAVGLYLWLLTIRFGREPTLLRGLGIAACTVVMFFCHVMALGFTALIALVYLAALHFREPKKVLLCWLPYTVGLPFITYWVISTAQRESYVQGAGVSFGTLTERVLTIFAQPAGQGGMTQPAVMAISIILIAIPFIAGARFSRDLHRWLPFAVAFTVIALMPAKAFGAILLYHRLSVFLVPLLLLALDFPTGEKTKSCYALLLAVVVCATLNITRFNTFNRETLGLTRVMSLMEERKNVLSLSIYPWSPLTRLPNHFHSGMWYQVEKRGIVDFNFAFFYPSLVRFKEGQHEWIPDDLLVWNPHYFNWGFNNGDHYDYFIIHSPDDPTETIFKTSRNKVELVENSNWWWLYRKK